ncbi:MAG: GNAT family N-acetyltransferase [Sulfuritalea sp.]|nr:GNAT family N-acetyltransferase [Sulfuritalea sp.]
MTIRNLEFLFRPKSIAVVADADPKSADESSRYAEVVLRNLAAGGFTGPVLRVTATTRSLFGMGTHVHIDALEIVPELAVVCVPLKDVAKIVARLGARGTRAVIVGSSIHENLKGSEIALARNAILDAARPNLVRILGPGSGGLVVPGSALNASVSPVNAIPGRIALIAQSAAVGAAVLDRANSRGIGFSSVIHLGSAVDIDLADALDWLAADPHTEAILVQFETVTVGHKFMSAARAAARNKPVVAIRGGGVAAGDSNDAFSTDDVYEAAMRRAGWVRIGTLEDLFDAAEALARVRPMIGERLSILANGRGFGRIAADALLSSRGRLAELSKETLRQLKKLLGTHSLTGNPVALPADVTAEEWSAALKILLADSETDAVLTVYSPSPFASSADVATAICSVAKASERNVFTCWVGGDAMLEAQQIAAWHGVLSHDSAEKAIAIFLGIVNYERNRELLAQMPSSVAQDFTPNINAARDVIAEAIDAGSDTLSPRQTRRLLQAYGIDLAEYPLARSLEEAIQRADDIGYPVDLGLVLANRGGHEMAATGLRSPADIQIAVRGLRSNVREQNPERRISGYRLRPSASRSGIDPLQIGVASDPVFGPVIFLGPANDGGVKSGNCALALPPLNMTLAQDLISRCRFAAELQAAERAALVKAACQTLVRISQLLTDIDEVATLELDPVHLESTGMLVLDAQIGIEKRERKQGLRRFAIRPYPKELEQRVTWQGRRILIRPIRPEDENTLGDLLGSLEPEDSRMRFFGAMRSLPRSQLARFTQIDYDREMALVAIERDKEGVEHSLGEVRAVTDPDNHAADFAIVVRSELKGQGLGRLLLQSIIDYSRSRGTDELRGETLGANLRMQHLARDLGFELKSGADLGTVELRLILRPPSRPAAKANRL